MRSNSSRRLALFVAATLAAALSGCATSGPSGAGVTATPLTQAGIGGRVHGGNQPIVGAEVVLWAAGTAGTYGTGATQLATTLSTAGGAFTFNNATTHASPCTPGQYLYITSSAGNPGAGTNNYAAMMAAIPTPCTSGATAPRPPSRGSTRSPPWPPSRRCSSL